MVSSVWRHHSTIWMRILRITTAGMSLLRPSLRLLRISVLTTISLSGVAVWLLSGMSGLRWHLRLWHDRSLLRNRLLKRLLLNDGLLSLLYRFRHWVWLCRLLCRHRLLCRLLNLRGLRLILCGFLHHSEEVSL